MATGAAPREVVSAGAAARTLLVMATVALLLAGCGFKLRTWDVGTSVSSAHVAGSERNPLTGPLERALRQAGVTLVERADQPEVIVELLDVRQERRSISVSGQARAAEYELILGVQYQVTDGAGAQLIAPQWLQRERVFRVDRDNIVGSSEEQALLVREMQTDLVQQILRALNTVTTEPPGAAAGR